MNIKILIGLCILSLILVAGCKEEISQSEKDLRERQLLEASLIKPCLEQGRCFCECSTCEVDIISGTTTETIIFKNLTETENKYNVTLECTEHQTIFIEPIEPIVYPKFECKNNWDCCDTIDCSGTLKANKSFCINKRCVDRPQLNELCNIIAVMDWEFKKPDCIYTSYNDECECYDFELVSPPKNITKQDSYKEISAIWKQTRTEAFEIKNISKWLD